jgi:hypothetical protein
VVIKSIVDPRREELHFHDAPTFMTLPVGRESSNSLDLVEPSATRRSSFFEVNHTCCPSDERRRFEVLNVASEMTAGRLLAVRIPTAVASFMILMKGKRQR